MENHLKLYKILLKKLSEILFYDYTINPEKLSSVKQKNIINYANIKYWEDILDGIKKGNLDRKNFNYHKDQLKKNIIDSSDNILKIISQLIEEKKYKLLNLPKFEIVRIQKAYPLYPPFENKFCIPYTHLYIGGIYPNSLRTTSVLEFNNCKKKIIKLTPNIISKKGEIEIGKFTAPLTKVENDITEYGDYN